MKLCTMVNQEGEKGLFTTEEISGSLELIFPIYKFKPTYIESPTRTSIQFEGKHFEDNIGKCINHSCNPNTKVTKLNETDNIALVPIKNIPKGKEITIDYNVTEEKLSHPFKCNCHGKLIRGNKYG